MFLDENVEKSVGEVYGGELIVLLNEPDNVL
jgi:hypothetical protein